MAVVAVDVFEDDVFEDAIFQDFTSDYVDRLDVLNKIVFIKADVTSFHPTVDMYPEVRSIRRIDESTRVKDNPVSAQGNEPAGANFTPRRAVLNDGWRIGLEFQSNWTLSITGEMISDDGFAGAQLVKLDYLPAGVSALVNYTPASSEVVTVSTGSGLDAAQDAKLTRMHTLLDEIENGLDHADVMKLLLAAMTAKVTGAETGTISFRDNADTKDRIVADVDGQGNRTAVTLDAT